jgi:AcrR family transcriptional regulator
LKKSTRREKTALQETLETFDIQKVSIVLPPIMEERDTKDKILKGAESLFMKYGVRSISMDDIARHLSVSKKTLYQHFADKEDIVTQVCQSHMEASWRKLENVRKSAANAIEELALLSVQLKKDMEEMNPSLLFDLQKYHPKAWAVWEKYKGVCVNDSMKRNLEQGIQEGYYRPDIDTDILGTARMCLVQIAFDDKVFPQNKFKLAEVQLQLFEQFVYGIVTEKGRKLYQKYREQNVQSSITI